MYFSGVHIVLQMGMTALSLISSVFVLRLVHTEYVSVPPLLLSVSLQPINEKQWEER